MKTLEDLLNEISVCWDWETAYKAGNYKWPRDWFAVINDEEILGYFKHEKDALAFRLMLINFQLNSKES